VHAITVKYTLTLCREMCLNHNKTRYLAKNVYAKSFQIIYVDVIVTAADAT